MTSTPRFILNNSVLFLGTSKAKNESQRVKANNHDHNIAITQFPTLVWNKPAAARIMPELKDKNGQPISEGDHVFARARGGRHEGEVEKIVTAEEDAKEEGVKHPPKVKMLSSSDGPGVL